MDEKFYRQQLSGPVADPMEHYRCTGDRLGLNPTPYFDTKYYKSQYPDWASRGSPTAFDDYLAHEKQGHWRSPHPLMSPTEYLRRYPDVAEAGISPMSHFINHGDAEKRSPSSGFNAEFYNRCYMTLGSSHPFRHYVTKGRANGYLPCPEPKDRKVSREAMEQAVAGMARPVLLVSHDAQAAGVPILTLDIARALTARNWEPMFFLRNAGPLLPEFKQLGPTFILGEGWDEAGLVSALPLNTPALLNTSVVASLATTLATTGLRCLVLIHEMADFVREHGLLSDLHEAQSAGAKLVASMPRMAKTLALEFHDVEQIRPGIVLPQTSLDAFRQVRLRVCEDRERPVFIGAGHADRRKGFDLFLQAAFAIKRTATDARFVWLGALDSWAQGLADEALAEGLDIQLPGFVSNSLAWYRAADVYLLTSRQDPGPATAIHAAAVGTPFVGYKADIGLIGFTDGVGSFVPKGDKEAFVNVALAKAFSNTPASRRNIRKKVQKGASFPRYVDELLSLIAGCQANG
jgi:Glycosyl transferases group 1